ncbi:MAG: FHA domain-containing protein [Chloroflexi bacterium]|nr:FHA domain-containing protein [Chloroflexota bacterium]
MISGNPLSETHILLNIVLVGDETMSGTSQPVLVRRDLTIGQLIEATLTEFAKEKELDRNSQYNMSVTDMSGGGRHILSADVPLREQMLDDGATLYMTYKVSGPVSANYEALREELRQNEATGLEITVEATNDALGRRQAFTLEKLPAIIGRRPMDTNYSSLDVDLTSLEEEGDRRISRAQARLSESGGQIFIEGLRESNPIRHGERQLKAGERQPLRSGDIITLRGVKLRITYRAR